MRILPKLRYRLRASSIFRAMNESGHSPSPSEAELREALRLLERALADQQARVRQAKDEDGSDAALAALRRSVHMMEQETDRLRALLPRD